MYSQPWSPTTLDDGDRAGVAHAEALAGHTADERLAAGRSVQRDVADDDVVLGAAPCGVAAAGSRAVPPESPLPT